MKQYLFAAEAGIRLDAHVPEPPGYEPETPPERTPGQPPERDPRLPPEREPGEPPEAPPPDDPGHDIDLPPRESPEQIRDPRQRPREDPPLHAAG